ncbi:hypothetical protein [Mesorhizobium shangrilense]|uniref:Uncharacterized protein n=1 Tax=Mesorhizobium shangrilense TaxID=460060 RepID=A0ABV2DGY1_9HYPH
MAKKHEKSTFETGDKGALAGHLYHMEPELRMLEGVVAALQAMSTTADMVEPIALAALAYVGGESLQKVLIAWRSALATHRQQQKEGTQK